MTHGETQRLIEVLERRAAQPCMVALRSSYIAALNLPANGTVVDLGTGSGVVARALAKSSGFGGRIIAIDSDQEMLSAARKRADSEGVLERIVFRQGEVEALDLADGSVDGVTAQGMYSHVHDPLRALTETARVLRAGGRLAIYDTDHELRMFSCTDIKLARRIEDAMRKLNQHSPRLISRMPEFLKKGGLSLVSVTPHIDVEWGRSGRWLEFVEKYADQIASNGDVSQREVETWLKDLRDADKNGTFFASGTSYVFIAESRQTS